jgi:putative addiction module component (TIGR02574 family)
MARARTEDAMSEAAKKLLAVLLELPVAERTAMRDALTESLTDGDDNLTRAEWEDAWAAEVERRIAASEASGDPGIPHEEVMRRMTEKYG